MAGVVYRSLKAIPDSKKLWQQKLWRTGAQNMFGRENISGLSIYQGETKGWQIKHWRIDQQSPSLPKSFTAYSISYSYIPG